MLWMALRCLRHPLTADIRQPEGYPSMYLFFFCVVDSRILLHVAKYALSFIARDF